MSAATNCDELRLIGSPFRTMITSSGDYLLAVRRWAGPFGWGCLLFRSLRVRCADEARILAEERASGVAEAQTAC